MSSSMSRSQPIIIIAASAAAALATFLIYSSAGKPYKPDLHRSRTVRRMQRDNRPASPTTVQTAPNHDDRVARLQQAASIPLGEVEDFFGYDIILDAARIFSPTQLRSVASVFRPDADPMDVEIHISIYYNLLVSRLIETHFSDRPSTQEQKELILRLLGHQMAHPDTADMVWHALEYYCPDVTQAVGSPPRPVELPQPQGEAQTPLKTALYYIMEKQLGDRMIHRSVTCSACHDSPIRGVRWHCANCYDFDLCSKCEASNSHPKTHLFYKISIPAPFLSLPVQRPVYPGCPEISLHNLTADAKRRLMSDLKLESNDIELLWCQFTALAATRWPKDPNQLGWAIDRTAFNRTFIPQFGSFTTPNLIHDRIFAHYDSNRDGLIGFQEFVSGLENMQERDLDKRLPVVFNGYDVDNDGYICRKDCLRMLRAHYDIEKAATRDYVNDASRDPTLNKRTNIIQSRQPLASAFSYSPTSTRSLNPYRPSDKPAGDFENMPQIMNNDSVDAIDPDVGNESLYQITQDGFNELLDPIFREREEIAQEATSTLAERKQRDRLPIHFGEHVHFNVAACRYGAFNYIRAVITELSMARMPSLFETKEKLRAYYEELLHLAETRVSSACPSFADQSGVSHHQLWRTQLIRQKFRQEWLDAMEEIGADRIQDMETTVEAQSGPNAGIPEKDPTWPQSRQNSDQSLTLPCAGVTPAKASNGSAVQETKILVASCDGMPPEAHPLDGDALEDHVIYYVSKPLPSHNDRPFIAWKLSTLISSAGNHAERSEEYLGSLIRLEASDPSSTLHDILLAYHDWVDRETAERGGPGRINLEELMELQKRDSDLRFLECWLTSWGNF